MTEEQHCRKCGNDDAPDIQYHRGICPVGWEKEAGCFDEHLHLKCRRCGYTWTHKVLQEDPPKV